MAEPLPTPERRTTVRPVLVAFALVLAFAVQQWPAFAAPAAPYTSEDTEYLQHLATALTEMRAGSYQSASQALAAAEEHRRDERLVYLIRAVGLLQAGAYGDAAAAVDLARKMGAEKELCDYATSLVRLAGRDYSGAMAAVGSSGRWARSADIKLLRSYISLMSGQAAPLDALAGDDSRTLALKAYTLLKSGREQEAAKLLDQIEPADPSTSTLDAGMVMSMNPAAPLLAMTTTSRAASLAVSQGKAAGGVFSGTVTLRADRTKTPNADYMLYYVDDKLIGIINAFPFEASWDTTRYSNGIHTVRIKGETRSGSSAGETSTQVIVFNQAPEPGPPLAGPAADKILDAVWQAMALAPSVTWAQYQKGIMAEAAGNTGAATLAYERILASLPLYLDVQERWKRLSGAKPTNVMWKGSGADGAIALTFDDGPNDGTRELLSALSSTGARATFFIVGSQARRDPEAIREMAKGGHEIACHSESHRSLTQMDEVELIRELFGPISIVHEITGRSPRFFRPPGGHLDAAGRRIAASFGLTPVMWTNHVGPYEGGSSRTMEQYVASNAGPGSVVLMHNCEPTTLEALPGIVSAVSARGLRAITISQLAR